MGGPELPHVEQVIQVAFAEPLRRALCNDAEPDLYRNPAESRVQSLGFGRSRSGRSIESVRHKITGQGTEPESYAAACTTFRSSRSSNSIPRPGRSGTRADPGE